MPQLHGPAEGRWLLLQPQAVATLLSSIRVPWWVAGGWALDLFLGTQTRPHGDFDIGLFRRDAAELMAGLPGWEFFEARSDTLYRLESHERPRPEVNSLWSRARNARSWSLQLLLDESEGDAWVYRRLPTVRMPIAQAIRRTPDGIPFLTPEIQLLYKSRRPRAKDQADFRRTVGRLEPGECAWLRTALSKVDPGHAWLSDLPI